MFCTNRGNDRRITMTFEQSMKRLEEISKILMDNEISLDESLELYSEGAKLIQFCNQKLKDVALKVSEIDSELQKGEE